MHCILANINEIIVVFHTPLKSKKLLELLRKWLIIVRKKYGLVREKEELSI